MSKENIDVLEQLLNLYARKSPQFCRHSLIYTSSSDSDGSLGGLVRNGRREKFASIFKNMLREAAWCSNTQSRGLFGDVLQ